MTGVGRAAIVEGLGLTVCNPMGFTGGIGGAGRNMGAAPGIAAWAVPGIGIAAWAVRGIAWAVPGIAAGHVPACISAGPVPGIAGGGGGAFASLFRGRARSAPSGAAQTLAMICPSHQALGLLYPPVRQCHSVIGEVAISNAARYGIVRPADLHAVQPCSQSKLNQCLFKYSR